MTDGCSPRFGGRIVLASVSYHLPWIREVTGLPDPFGPRCPDLPA